jgi:hypothetical protein
MRALPWLVLPAAAALLLTLPSGGQAQDQERKERHERQAQLRGMDRMQAIFGPQGLGGSHDHKHKPPPPPPPPPPPTLTISFNPPAPKVSESAPLATPVATIIITVSDGSLFSGTLGFGPPYGNGGGCFGIQVRTLIIACDLKAVLPTGGTLYTTVTANTQ